ncbi:MAG: hypothetical protein RL141_927 [Candidatus Parcubacteria bacterium]|jgi:citrate synthase
MEFSSSIGMNQNGVYALRGTPIPALIAEADVVSTLWLAWTGARPSNSVRQVLHACLVACMDHGTEPPSAQVTRITASCGKPLADAVAAGVLTLGPRHGNAAGDASRWIREAVAAGRPPVDVATEAVTSKSRLSGIGHPVYEQDPRTAALHEVARAAGISNTHQAFGIAVAQEISSLKGKTMPLNVDGMLGAIMADIDAPPACADALFLAARVMGLAAHAMEESTQSTSYHRG